MNVAASLETTLNELDQAGLLGPSDAALVALVTELAMIIDDGQPTAALVREYRIALSELTSRNRGSDGALDALMAVLRGDS